MVHICICGIANLNYIIFETYQQKGSLYGYQIFMADISSEVVVCVIEMRSSVWFNNALRSNHLDKTDLVQVYFIYTIAYEF